jgi:hypothetical protein
MRVLTECGGVRATVVKRSMQRSPVFMLGTAREARDFGEWITANFGGIKAVAETTTKIGRLVEIEQYAIANLLYLRFDYTTGDAAGIVGGPAWVPLDTIALPFPGVKLNPTAAGRFTHGQEVMVFSPGVDGLLAGSSIAVRDHDGRLLGIGEVRALLARGRTLNIAPAVVLDFAGGTAAASDRG